MVFYSIEYTGYKLMKSLRFDKSQNFCQIIKLKASSITTQYFINLQWDIGFDNIIM